MITFEQGPIRPPSEAGSLLLRFTRNCPWNRCTFCPVYKGQKFSKRSLQDIKGDIDKVRHIIDDLHELSQSMGIQGTMPQPVLNSVLSRPDLGHVYHYVAMWFFHGKGRVFIQDANSLMLPTTVITEALHYLRQRVPGIQRITSYGRSSTLAKKSVRELREIREAGLDRIHIGMESGCDAVLEFVRKGSTALDHIIAGRRVIEAGMTLSEYVMPGLGGKALSREHALDTAYALNAIEPHFIRLRSLRIPSRAPLHQDVTEGRFTPLSDDETVEEIRLFIDTLEDIHSELTSDHIMNLIPDVEGTLPRDKGKMLAAIDRYLQLAPDERLLYRLGRRGGAIHSLDDFSDSALRNRLERARCDLEARMGTDLESLITELGDQYI